MSSLKAWEISRCGGLQALLATIPPSPQPGLTKAEEEGGYSFETPSSVHAYLPRFGSQQRKLAGGGECGGGELLQKIHRLSQGDSASLHLTPFPGRPPRHSRLGHGAKGQITEPEAEGSACRTLRLSFCL